MTARPAVLRALTDLFCLRNNPLDEEVERFREFALKILPNAGPSTRLYVAAKLARHPLAPRDVLTRLAEADPPCATLLLEHAKNFPVEAQIGAARNAIARPRSRSPRARTWRPRSAKRSSRATIPSSRARCRRMRRRKSRLRPLNK